MSHRETIVTCNSCGAAQVAYIASDGAVSVNGQAGCRRCGDGDFVEHSGSDEGAR